MAYADGVAVTVAALYVDPRGPYPTLLGPEYCWDEARDARTYSGPWPVVAHPPCAQWSAMRHLAKQQTAHLAFDALRMLWMYGGVLEHPAYSRLWDFVGLPKPGELPDHRGGHSHEVYQVDWGHVARKRTWLYVLGAPAKYVEARLAERRGTREPTHWVSGGRKPRAGRSLKTLVPDGVLVCSSQQRKRTPEPFASLLIEIAEKAA